ncbi:hypothetical protein [Brevibacillus reuszeri]|uniref:hypothetical protein n=1 Tax=Brevibacillus reuszeri TaxID=54915 RepID=UPI000CCC7D95|nr:hypothetical protein [Brevibacillus reuszeri]
MEDQIEENLIKDAFKKHGFDISLEQAADVWSEYSRLYYFASWMPVPNDLDLIFKDTKEYAISLGYIQIEQWN